MNLILRAWQDSDKDALLTMFMHFMEEEVLRGGNVIPNAHNAEAYYMLGQHFSKQGTGTVLVEYEGEPIGFTLMGDTPSMFQLSERCWTSFGTYVKPEFRHSRVATEMYEQLEAKGIAATEYDCVYTQVDMANTKGLEVLTQRGYIPMRVTMRKGRD